jgi:hypothetical protein
MTSQPGARSYDLTRALPSLAGTLTAILDSARYLIPRPGDLSRQSAPPGRSPAWPASRPDSWCR